MTSQEATKNQVADFFDRYPTAEKCFVVSDQLFHANAEDMAKARAAFYGLTVETYSNPNVTKKAAKFIDKAIAELDADKLNKILGETAENGEVTQNTEGGETAENGATQNTEGVETAAQSVDNQAIGGTKPTKAKKEKR